MLKQIQAPFTVEQVVALNAYQRSGAMHPYTCAHSSDERHPAGAVLNATVHGWQCPHCAYSQLWAHEFAAVPACQECGAYDEPLHVGSDLGISCKPCAATAKSA